MSGHNTSAKRKKIILVGPVRPYRGGIARYNDELSLALREYADTEVLSFRRLYPKFLYPGKTDRTNESLLKSAHYILDSNNPYSLLQAARFIRDTKPDFVIVTWWTIFWQPQMWLICKLISHRTRVALLCHNFYDHDAGKLKRRMSKLLSSFSSTFIVHSSDDRRAIEETFPNKTLHILQRNEPVSEGPEPTVADPDNSRLKVLFFGLIREYKGLDTLIQAFESMSPDQRGKIEINVVGEVWGQSGNELSNRLTSLSIKHNFEFVTEQEMANVIKASHLLVLPYKSATGSGVIPTAYYYDKPVLVTDVGGLPGAVEMNKTGWVIDANRPDKLAEALLSITPQMCVKMKRNIRQWVSQNTWSAHAKEIIKTLEEIE